jgi:ubiquitin-conjugating enzyme E2 Q
MNGALCMELLTSDGWNPVNDIESVIVSIRSLLVVGDGRLEDAAKMPQEKYETLLAAAMSKGNNNSSSSAYGGHGKKEEEEDDDDDDANHNENSSERGVKRKHESNTSSVKGYSTTEAKAAYTHLSSYHKKKGWSGWWAQRG